VDNFFLSDLNRKISSRAVIRWVAVSAFVILSAYVTVTASRGKLGAPPQAGDGPDYDNIALQLSKGNGYSVRTDDPEYRPPYLAQNKDGSYNYLMNAHGAGPTAYRPPLLPLLMAGSYKLFGRHFAPVRFMNMTFIAAAIALSFFLVARRFGIAPGLLALLLLLVDDRLRYYASMILTEAVACFLMTATFYLIVRTIETKSRRWAITLGAVLGLAFLSRSVLFFFMPPIAITILVLTRLKGERWFAARSLRPALLFVAAFIVVSAPWLIRNCIVLRRFEPLGTQGAIGLIGGYSDKTLAQNGEWVPDLGSFDSQTLQGKSELEAEQIMADYGKGETLRWIIQNPSKIPRLALLKVRSEWAPQDLVQTFLLAFAAVGFLIYLSCSRHEAIVCFCLLITATLVVAATYAAGGRFLVPFVPVLGMLSAVGLWSFLIAATELPLDRLRLQSLDTDKE
jgi:4-amino-4-deoxy-L-arabinose transferase-like glycosyltransferase